MRSPTGLRAKGRSMSPRSEYARALLRKAGEDQYVANRLAADEGGPAWVIGFHAEQAVEKALKAVLSAVRVRPSQLQRGAMVSRARRAP
jgi:HEPN domain-containing protein